MPSLIDGDLISVFGIIRLLKPKLSWLLVNLRAGYCCIC